MSVLVLGATGNLRPHLVAGLLDLGVRPRVVIRDGESEFFSFTVQDVAGHQARTIEAFLDEKLVAA